MKTLFFTVTLLNCLTSSYAIQTCEYMRDPEQTLCYQNRQVIALLEGNASACPPVPTITSTYKCEADCNNKFYSVGVQKMYTYVSTPVDAETPLLELCKNSQTESRAPHAYIQNLKCDPVL